MPKEVSAVPLKLMSPRLGADEDAKGKTRLVPRYTASPRGCSQVEADKGLFLAETYRLHPDIAKFTSEIYYEGKVDVLKVTLPGF